MQDAVLILLAVALTTLLRRPDEPRQYVVTVAAVGVPVVLPLLLIGANHAGVVEGAVWTRRGVPHSLLAGAAVVAVGAYFGYPHEAAIGYGTQFVADLLVGGVMPFAPFSALRIELLPVGPTGAYLTNLVSAVFAMAVFARILRNGGPSPVGLEGDDTEPESERPAERGD